MSTKQSTIRERDTATTINSRLRTGAVLMALAGLAFIGYGLVFLVRTFFGSGFELGVATLNGVTKAELTAMNPAIVHYITHLHVATAAFIIATGIAVTALAWYGVRAGQRWAWATAVVAPVVALGIALPMHYLGLFVHDWVVHLAPIYLAVIVFVIGAGMAYQGMKIASASDTETSPM